MRAPFLTPDPAIKQACQKTGACWAARLESVRGEWQLRGKYRLTRRAEAELFLLLTQPAVHTWLSGAAAVGRARSRSLPAGSVLACRRLFVFPEGHSGRVIVVGADSLSARALPVWRELQSDPSAGTGSVPFDAGSETARLELIRVTAEQVQGLTSLPQVTQKVADLVCHHLPADLCAVFTVGRNGSVSLQGLTGGAPVRERLDSLAEKPLPASAHLSAEGGILDGAELWVPLSSQGASLGALLVASRAAAAFSSADLSALRALAAVLSNVMTTAAQYETLRDTVFQLQETEQELQARINAQKEAESRLVQAAKLAAVGEMAAGVAHELNNPLTTVVGFTELVFDELPDDSPHKSDLDLVLQEARRARTVVRRLLDFARQGERVRTRTDLNEIVADVLALMRHLMHTSGIEVTLTLEKDLPWIMVERNQIKQVILNLLHNALNAIPRGGGRIDVTTRSQTHYGSPFLTVSIRDSGVGIPEENLGRIFEPFFTTRSGQGGTGLGLSVTYGIVTDHHGFIEVESTLNVGSSFTVWLPVEG